MTLDKTRTNWLSRAWQYITSRLLYLLQAFTIALRYCWLLFPAIIFVVVSWYCFWQLAQGRDLLISACENRASGPVLMVALLFWVFITWYSSRILVYKRKELFFAGQKFITEAELPPPSRWFSIRRLLYTAGEKPGFHLPRLLGFLCFSIIILGFAQLPTIGNWRIGSSRATWFLFLYIVMYYLIGKLFIKIGHWIGPKHIEKIMWMLLALFILLFCLPIFIKYNPNAREQNAKAIIYCLTIVQCCFLFVVTNRRKLMHAFRISNADDEATDDGPVRKINVKLLRKINKVMDFAEIPKHELYLFLVFNFFSLIAIVIYITGIFDLRVAYTVGSLIFAIIAFGVLVGYFNIVSIFSIHFRINFHIVIFLMVIFSGMSREPHRVRLSENGNHNPTVFSERLTMDSFFLKWAAQRRVEIERDSAYPVLFVLADGGASRSGYWTASVLGRLEDQTEGKFSRHLFCLSGASGGSVGNGTFLALLKHKEEAKKAGYANAAQEYLKTDFLTFTLARMLGPDFFRPLLPIWNLDQMYDRAGALELALERGMENSVLLKNKLAEPFSSFIPNKQDSLSLPVICINTTRMQDGNPGIVSNIQITGSVFGKRIDVLAEVDSLKKNMDMHLSTAIVLGARFPYVNPAGRIGDQYFVDGGYFDNSGAGAVNEMIIRMKMMVDSMGGKPGYKYLKNLRFYVVHTINSPLASTVFDKVHPLKNDLAAPLITLAGSYGTQTDVNNWRLIQYLPQANASGNNTLFYWPVNLYTPGDNSSYPMSWTISNYYREKMNNVLVRNESLQKLVVWMNGKL
jgi:predicted acylesterase/phospholipase RssA